MSAPDLAPEISSEVQGDARWILIERIAASQHLRSSPRLRDFLFYVADCAIREAPEEATEQQIGIRIFHRHPGYNSSEDSIVRTHARLLRQKLAGYFAEEGIGEEFVVDIPKGHYVPVFHPRTEVTAGNAAEAGPTPVIATPISVERTHWQKWIAGLLLPILVVCAIFAWQFWARPAPPQSAVESFWKPFFTDDPPLVIYSNAVFVGDSTNGLRYARPQDQENLERTDNYVDTYTGIGELASVYALTTLFDAHNAHFILKRSLLMTWDEATAKNLIFIGSTAENASLRVLPSTMDFTLTAGPDFAGFINHHPKPGEPMLYSRPEHPLTRDYAVLALLPGVQPGKRMLIFSGLTTFGTQAAVDYVCQPDTTANLLKQIIGPKGDIRPFEALLETTIGGGVPLQTRLVTIRVH
jgi:hypothetical protein